MSLHLLDTDILQLFQDGDPNVVKRVLSVKATTLSISVVTVEEQLSGWYALLRKAKRSEQLTWAYARLAENVRFLSRIQIADFSAQIALRCEELKKLKLRVGTMDLRIAATALENGAQLVTRNFSDFQMIPGIQLADWSK